MKHVLGIVFALLFAACHFPLHGQPRVTVEGGNTFDFGTINRGEIVKKKVFLKNTGTDTLVLRRVVPSCGCTGAVTSSDHIAPGATGSVEITFNSQNASGTMHKTVSIETNVPDSPQTVISFAANVIEEITMTPSQCLIKDAEVGKPVALTIVIQNTGKEGLRLLSYTTELAGFALKLPAAMIKPGQSAEVRVTFTPTRAVPILYESARIKTSNPRMAELYLPIYGNVKESKPE